MASYQSPDDRQAIIEFGTTVIPFCAACWLAWALYAVHPALGLIGALPASVFLVRLFMLQHDCGHGSMFSSRRLNDWVGNWLCAYPVWSNVEGYRRYHLRHHAKTGSVEASLAKTARTSARRGRRAARGGARRPALEG